ncbi:hypothetical protein KOXY103107_04740 [Komagataeibacter xylinus]
MHWAQVLEAIMRFAPYIVGYVTASARYGIRALARAHFRPPGLTSVKRF